jgi:myo-inositol 2-dehydrogenase / D-chiro-inositol 1-dehydrogenase
MGQLRIGIVGCGRMGRERARCTIEAGDSLAGVFDIDAGRSAELAEKYGVQSVSHVPQIFELGLDALFLCTAPGTRGPVETRCIERGLPFYVEKPIGISSDGCQELADRLAHNPVLNGVGYMNRYRSSIQLARDILAATSVIGFSAHWVCKRYNVPWWEVEQHSGGPHNEQATHLVDLVRFLIGEIESVKSIFSGNSRASTTLECEGDIPGTTFYSCDGNEKDIGIRIFTRSGSLVLSGWDFHLAENSIDGRVTATNEEDIFLVETTNFLTAVRLRDQTLVKSDFRDAVKTQAVMDAIRRSSRLTEPVEELSPTL